MPRGSGQLGNALVDELDRRIIACLQASGRQSNTQIASQLGVTESTVRKRIDRLLANEVIRITAVANPLKLNYPIVAILGIHAEPTQINTVAQALNELPEFRFIGITTGVWDFVTEAWFESLIELYTFLSERLWPIKGITRVEASHVIHMVRYAYDWGRDIDGRTLTPSGLERVPLESLTDGLHQSPVQAMDR
jgi:Lrp/AsnC family transcriptional regulator, regulator for asnA, asnC and gidA